MNRSFLHKIAPIILALILLAYNIRLVSIMVDFALHQDQISKTLCVQKENQQGCNGKCQLVKSLTIDTNFNQEIPSENIEKSSLSYNFIQPNTAVNFNSIPSKNLKTNYAYNNNTFNKLFFKIILPPPELS